MADIDALVSILYAAFEGATQQAREFFDARQIESDPFLYPAMVRFFVKRDLDGRGHSTTEYERGELANNGLKVSYQGPSGRKYEIRMLKADNGKLPPPGDSRAKQRFYRQEQLVFAFVSTQDPMAGALGLVVLWETTFNYNFWQLQLSCPSNGLNTRRITHDHWTVRIPHPAETAKSTAEQSNYDTDDVGFTLPQDDTGTGNGGNEDAE